jgi:O-methyltransferase
MMSFDEHKIVLTCLQDVLNKNIDGDVVEMGVFGGSTSIMIQKLLEFNNSNKKLHAYDSFEGFPQTNNNEDAGQGGRCGGVWLHQIEGELAFSLDNYVQNIENNNVKMPIINKGFFSDIPDNKYPDKMCFVFYDGDLYQSTLDALNKVYNKVVKNGTIVFEFADLTNENNNQKVNNYG